MRLAADANVLLSAVLGHAALRAIDEGKVELVTTLVTLKEVKEYLPDLAEKAGLDPMTLLENLELLGVLSYGPKKYRKHLVEARRRIAARDPDDVPLLALALSLQLPVWSNDRHFEGSGDLDNDFLLDLPAIRASAEAARREYHKKGGIPHEKVLRDVNAGLRRKRQEFRRKVDRGLQELRDGKEIPHNEVKRRLKKWLKKG